jgi:tight adherence protein B
MLQFALYALAFTAVVLAVEGAGRLVRARFGEERAVSRRLDRIRSRPVRPDGGGAPDRLTAFIDARFPSLQRALARAGTPVASGQLAPAVLFGFLLVAGALSAAGAPRVIALPFAFALAVGIPAIVFASAAARRQKRFLNQLPQAVDLMARSLQAGHPVGTAMSVVAQRMPAPLGPEFQTVIDEMTYGLDRNAALENLLQRFPVAELRMFTASLEVTRESGGNLAEVFLKLAESIRAKDHLRRKIVAISAEGRITFFVVTALPFLVGGALLVLRPGLYLDVADDPLFWPMMSCAPLTLAAGAFVIWRMVNIRI